MATKVGKSLQVTLATVGTKNTTVKLTIKDPSGKSFQLANTKVAKNKAFSGPRIKFAKAGSYVVTTTIGNTKRTVTVKVTK